MSFVEEIRFLTVIIVSVAFLLVTLYSQYATLWHTCQAERFILPESRSI